jgi:periplasmic divalent cation tolerance protein
MDRIIDVMATYGDEASAMAAARQLVEKRLAACVHVYGPVTSTFRWDGAVQVEPEWKLDAKTRRELFETVAAEIAADHPYELPAIHATPAFATDAYTRWVFEETAPAPGA